MQSYMWIALGGAVGGAARYWCSQLLLRPSAGLAWGTLLVNVTGAFAIGLLTALYGASPSGLWQQTLIMGVCGSFTTLSAVSLHGWQLLCSGRWLSALANLLANLLLAVAAVAAGQHLLS